MLIIWNIGASTIVEMKNWALGGGLQQLDNRVSSTSGSQLHSGYSHQTSWTQSTS